MKTSALLAFIFLFALFAFTTAEYVYDSDGEPLDNAGEYYLSPLYPVGGGQILAVEIWKGESDTCSLAVVHERYKEGWSVRIGTPVNVSHITTNSFLRISFAHLPHNPCTRTPNWIVVPYIGFADSVMVGSDEEFPMQLTGWFYIKPVHDSNKYNYNLVFCHKEDECGKIGVRKDSHENHRLVITDEDPLVYKIDKVKESVNSGVSMVA